MAGYVNAMELLVREQLDKMMETDDGCKCQRCRDDMIAFALNQMPPKYVVSSQGEVYAKAYLLQQQHLTDLVAAVSMAVKVVRRAPRH